LLSTLKIIFRLKLPLHDLRGNPLFPQESSEELILRKSPAMSISSEHTCRWASAAYMDFGEALLAT